MTMFNVDAYRRVLAVPGFAAFLLLGLLLNVPTTAAPVVLTLYTVIGRHGASFGAAGLVVGLWTVGMAVGLPLQGWVMDRRGFRPIFLAAVLVHAGFWGLALVMPLPVLAVTAFVSGLFVVPGGTITRMAVSALVPEDSRHTAYAASSMLAGLSVLVVPALGVVVATQVSMSAAVLGVGAVFVLSGALLVTRELPSGQQLAGGGGVRSVLSGRLVATFACVAAVGVMTSGSDVVLLATLKSVGQTTWAGAVLAVCAASSLFGGFVYGGRERGWPPAPMVVVMGLFMIPIGLWADWRWLFVAFVPVALLVAPAYSALAHVAGELAGRHARATVMSVFGTAVMVGNALGPPLAGVVYDLGSHQLGFAVIGVVGVLVGLLARQPLRRSVSEPARDTTPVTVESEK
jgi:MFS family permease